MEIVGCRYTRLAIGLFLVLLVSRIGLLIAKIQDPFLSSLDNFLAALFGSILTLFQQRARQETNINAPIANAEIDVNDKGGKG